jgi:hypothetical protein
LKWSQCSDPDGDEITYKLYIATEPSFLGVDPLTFPAPQGPPQARLLGYPAVALIVLGVAISGFSRRRRRVGLFIALIATAALCLCTLPSFGGGESRDAFFGKVNKAEPTDERHSVQGLQPGTAYYWKVVAEDGNGGQAESDTFCFTTRK